jgi:adenylate cyclase
VREVSIVVADLRGFTAFCEEVPPERVSAVLNEYLALMVEVILRQGGRVQDFIGDGILAVFGAPALDPDHAWHAVLSALKMQTAIRRLHAPHEPDTAASFALGVAVHSGTVFAGVVGCPRQSKYAAVGDPVNTAARLEELNRTLGTKILITGETLARLSDRIVVRPRGLYSLRGRLHKVDVYEPLGVR